MQPSHVLRTARSKARLKAPLLAEMAGVTVERLGDLEAGKDEPSPDEVEAFSLVFGLSSVELMAGAAEDAPLTGLFLRAEGAGEVALHELIATGAHRTLGELMRCVREAADLERRLGVIPKGALPEPPTNLTSRLLDAPPHGAEELATWLRQELRLGSDPIDSMVDVVRKLDVMVFWTTPEALDPNIDGASTPFPRPAILVNLVEGPGCWWRTRMTLAHELCHILCDRRDDPHFALFSPDVRNQETFSTHWRLYDGFDRVERRARAFAACLLAPADAVRRVVGGMDETSEAAISAVGKRFGLGRTTAINRLQRVFNLSQYERQAMAARSASHWPSDEHPDRAPDQVGLRRGPLGVLALRAYTQGLIDGVEVRRALGLPLTEPLPEYPGLTPERRRALRTMEDRARRAVSALLAQNDATASCFASDVERTREGWRVEIAGAPRTPDSRPIPLGHILMSRDLVEISREIDLRRLDVASV